MLYVSCEVNTRLDHVKMYQEVNSGLTKTLFFPRYLPVVVFVSDGFGI
jgi:hypothetical protein